MPDDTPTHIHPWEKAGLGTAPFRYTGYERITYQACRDAPIQPGSTCDYCGTAISSVYWIRSNDGRTFKVGSTCVGKTNARGSRVFTEVQKAARKAKRQEATERAKERRADLVAYLLTIEGRRALRALSHPQTWRAENGETLLNSVVWTLRHAGQAGTLKTIRMVNRVTGAKF